LAHCFELLKHILDSEHSRDLYCFLINCAFLFIAVKSVQLHFTLLIIRNLTQSEIFNFFNTTDKILSVSIVQSAVTPSQPRFPQNLKLKQLILEEYD